MKNLSVADSRVTTSGFAALRGLRLESLDASGTKIDDRALDHLANSTTLRVLTLSDTRISNKAVEFIADHFPKLEKLGLSRTSIGDQSVPHLVKLKHLVYLGLAETDITDAAIPMLSSMTQLKELDIRRVPPDNISISKEGANRLRRALPNTEIVHW